MTPFLPVYRLTWVARPFYPEPAAALSCGCPPGQPDGVQPVVAVIVSTVCNHRRAWQILPDPHLLVHAGHTRLPLRLTLPFADLEEAADAVRTYLEHLLEDARHRPHPEPAGGRDRIRHAIDVADLVARGGA